MEFLKDAFDFVMHIDQGLADAVQQYGVYVYPLLFAIVFVETGFVIMPFLPGDSLLFAAGALAQKGSLDLRLLIGLLIVAPLCGDNVNYWLGRLIGSRVARSRFVKKEYLERTHRFYENQGPKTIILARFVPIVRTFAPFVAGIGRMNYLRFLSYSIIGAIVWVVSLTLAGYYFGGLPIVKDNFTIVIFAIIGISLVPAVVEFIKLKWGRREPLPQDQPPAEK